MATIFENVATLVKGQAETLAQLKAASAQDQAWQTKLLAAVDGIAALLGEMAKVQEMIALDVDAIKLAVVADTKPVGITVDPGTPVERKSSMPPIIQAKWAKKSKQKKAVPHKAGDPIVAFQFTDNEDGTATVNGLNAAGDVLDLSATYTLTPVPTSDTPAVVSIDAPNAMTFGYHGLSVGSANILAQATQNAGVTPPAGPFAYTLPMTCIADPNATGIIVNPGIPTPRPPVTPPSP